MSNSNSNSNTESAPVAQDGQVTAAGSGAGPATYTVTGMTCGHCVAAVTEEVSEIDGVRDVTVDLATGNLTFACDRPVTRDAVDAAVREAGYALA